MIRHAMDVVKAAINELNPGQIPVVTLDQPLYAIAKQVQWNWPDTHGEDLFVVMLGGLHTEMAALKTAGDWLQDSGWTQALVQAEIATAGTADSFLRAAHVSRTRRAHQVTVAALHILQHRAYDIYNERATARDEEPLEFEAWCDQRAAACPQFQYWATVLNLELCILLYIRSLRESNFTLYMDTLPELAAWFAALDHIHYARWLPVHIRDMVGIAEKHPDVAAKFHAGHFTSKKTRHAFSAISLDQAHEQNNATVKGDGGAVGLTENPSALRRWMVAGPEVARVITEFETSQQLRQRGEHTHHHEQTDSVQKKFVQDVRALTTVIEEMGSPFEEESTDLLVLGTLEILGPAVVDTVRTAVQIGRDQFHSFEKERLADRSKPLNDVIKRNKLPLFSSIKVKAAQKSKQQVASAKSDSELFSRLYIACQTRDGGLEQFFKHENSAHPPALSQDGQLRFGSKADLLQPLEQLVETKSDPPQVSSVILDGAVIVQMLSPGQTKTFLDYATKVFIPYIMSQLQHRSRLDLVWDRYAKSGSLKATARTNRGKGIRRRVTGSALLPGNWHSFLRVDENKEELFSFLSKQVTESIDVPDKQLIATDGEQVIAVPPCADTAALAPCNHEEADTRMMLHAAAAMKSGHHRVLIRTVDTDVVVLAVWMAQELNEVVDELWLALGTGKNFRYIAAHELSATLGPDKAKALPIFHAITGCDTVSSFAGRGKKTAWAVWETFPEVTNAFLDLASAPSEISEDTLATLERYVVLLYDRTCTCSEVNLARKKLFAKKSRSIEAIPPTQAALVQHVKRATYQGGHCWGQSLVPHCYLPSPCDWGWVDNDGQFDPLWTTLPEAAKSCYELICCGCENGCSGRCKCKKAALKCTALCACDGDCSH
uniref:uncharacterized protein n=1 Tax=Myxine glutinosa TaxID=7769 RepID=UPI00358F05C7